jgi:hypothetical protein
VDFTGKAAAGDAVLGQSVAWTVINNGFVHGDGSGHAGINLAAGGVVKNDAGGKILGDAGAAGVIIARTGGVRNYGQITGSIGVVLAAGDFVTNGFSNLFQRTLGTIVGGTYGVFGSTGTVSNIGTISGGAGVGIRFTDTASVTNRYGTISGNKGIPAYHRASASLTR